MINTAKCICREKHEGQVDKCGKPYWMHPFAVADAVVGDDAKTVAYLHDVVEDTDATLEWLLEQGFPAHIVDAVDAITRRDGETYDDFIVRAGRNDIARRVKIADLRHNLDPSRKGATPEMRERYKRALEYLTIMEIGEGGVQTYAI